MVSCHLSFEFALSLPALSQSSASKGSMLFAPCSVLTLEPSANGHAIDQGFIAVKEVHIEFWGYCPGLTNMKPIPYTRPEKKFVVAVSVLKSRPKHKSQTSIRVDKNESGEHKRIEVPPNILCYAAQTDPFCLAVLIICSDCEPVLMTLFSISKKKPHVVRMEFLLNTMLIFSARTAYPNSY
jgi:hypothetical protein